MCTAIAYTGSIPLEYGVTGQDLFVTVHVHEQGRPPILARVLGRTVYSVGKFMTIYFKNCATSTFFTAALLVQVFF